MPRTPPGFKNPPSYGKKKHQKVRVRVAPPSPEDARSEHPLPGRTHKTPPRRRSGAHGVSMPTNEAGRSHPAPEIQTGLGPRTRKKHTPVSPAFLAPPESPPVHGEHAADLPFSDWYRRRLVHPNPAEEVRVLGFQGASDLNRHRHELQNALFNASAPRAGVGIGEPRKLSQSEIADIMLHQAGLTHDIENAAHVANPGGLAEALAPGLSGYLRSGGQTHRAGALFDVGATVFAPLRGVRGGVEVARAAKGGETAIEALKAGQTAYKESTPFRTAGRKLLAKPVERILQHEGLTVKLPAAKSLFGRQLEKAYDFGLKRTGRMPKRVGAEFARRERTMTARERAVSNRLRAVARRLSPEEHYALRIVGENTTPAERISHHQGMFEHARNSMEATRHAIHMELIRGASKFVETHTLTPEERHAWAEAHNVPFEKSPRTIEQLREDAPKKLQRAWQLIQQAGDKREEIITNLGKALDETLSKRLETPGRVIKGAKWVPHEKLIQQELAASPERQAVHGFIDQHLDPQEATDLKSMWDRLSLAYSQRHGVKDETGKLVQELAPDALYKKIAGVETHASSDILKGELPEELKPLYQHAPPLEAPKMPERLRLRGLKPNVYNMIREGAAYRDWYVRGAAVIKDAAKRLGITKAQMAAVTAITSQGANPTFNLKLAVEAIQEFKDTGTIAKSGYLYDHHKVIEVLTHPDTFDWKGLKTNSYFSNFLKHLDPKMYKRLFGDSRKVTIDRHMAAMLYGNSSPTPKQYKQAEELFVRTADKLGWSPEEVQAAAWVPWKARNTAATRDVQALGKEMRARGEIPKNLLGTDANTARKRAAFIREHFDAGRRAEGVAPAPHEPYLGSAADAYEKGQAKYRDVLYQTEDVGHRLEGLPTTGRNHGPDEDLQALAGHYMEHTGQEYVPPRTYAHVDEARAKRIAQAYEDMAHDPHNPEVARAYQAMIDETLAQYNDLVDAGYTFEFMPKGEDPYASPWDSAADIRNNKHMYVFPTEAGFGTDLQYPDNPLLGDSGIEWNGQKVTHNDLFRGVHDAFGHVKEGVGFRADGEENAWRQHVAMYSPEARKAMTVETRGQNSWVNFGPHGEANRTANQAETVYADQKTGLLPDWVVTEGAGDFSGLTKEEATARLSELDAEYNKVLKGLLGDRKSIDPLEQLRRNKTNGLIDKFERTGERKAGTAKALRAGRQPTLSSENEKLAQQELENIIVKHADDPAVKAFVARQEEAAGLREALKSPEPEAVFQRGRSDTVKGAAQFLDDGRAIIHAVQNSADVSTFAHETAHILRRYALTPYDERIAAKWAGALPIKHEGKTVGYKWSTKAEEKFAQGFETYLREGRYPATGMRDIFKRMANALREVMRGSAIEDLSPGMREVYDRLFRYEEHQGDVLVGPGHEGATTYFKYERGAPVELRHVGAYVGGFRKAFFSAGKGRAVGAGPQYVEDLRKGFRGSLLLSGRFKVDVARATADSLIKASRLASASRTREALLKASTEIPTSAHDIPILEDVSTTGLSAEERAARDKGKKEFQARADELMGMAMGDKKVTEKSLSRIEGDAIEQLRREWFPEEINGEASGAVAARLAGHDGAEAIPNIRWVNHRLMDATGVFDVSAAKGTQLAAVRALIQGVDTFNDLQRATILFLAPKYIPMNLAGNLVMTLFQQGVFAIPNLAKAAALNWKIDERFHSMIDELMGHGFSSILESRGGHTIITDRLAHAAGAVVDLIPRRAAWLHEARREGLTDLGSVQSLLEAFQRDEPWANDVVDRITRAANDAIIDYDRMGPLEKNLVRRVIFFYPWVKGATRYSARFIVEHPYEAAALGLLAYYEQKQANEDLGPRPYYAQWLYKVGEDSNGLPLTINLQQAVPFTTPIDQAASLYGTITGDQAFPNEFEQLTPIGSSLFDLAASYSPIARHSKEGQGNILDRFNRILSSNTPMITMYENLNQKQSEKANRVFPRTKREEITRYMLGSLFTPQPYNAKVAQASMHEKAAASAEENTAKWAAQVSKALGEPVPRAIRELKLEHETYTAAARDIKKDMGIPSSTKISDLPPDQALEYDRRHYLLKLSLLAKRDPATAHALGPAIHQAPDKATLDALGSGLDDALGWSLVDEYSQATR